MSVYPEFIQHIHDESLYVHGFNYEEMYNVMVYTLTHNIIPTTNFIYTYQQVDYLYEYLEELLTPIEDTESDDTNYNNDNNQNNHNNQNEHQNENDIIAIEIPLEDSPLEDSDIYDEIDEDIHTSAYQNDMQNEYTDNQNAQALFNNYIQLLNNAANITQNQNHTNQNQNHTNDNIYYTNLTYHNNYNIL